MTPFVSILIATAIEEIGTAEVGNTNCGKRVNLYKAATNLPPQESWPWCAAFMCWCIQQAMQKCGIKETPTFRRPTTASAFDFINWSLAQDNTTQTLRPIRSFKQIMAGDILIFKFSHIGLAVRDAREDGTVSTVEGNTDGQGTAEGGAVLRKCRSIDQVKARIRFTI